MFLTSHSKVASCTLKYGNSTLDIIQFSSVAQSCLALYDPKDIRAPGFPVLHQLLEPVQTHVHQVGNAIQPSHIPFCPLLFLPSVFPIIRVFSNESVLRIIWLEHRSFSFSISPSNEYSELISFWIDWLDLLAVQGTLKSLLQHHSLRASIPWHSQPSLWSNFHIHT